MAAARDGGRRGEGRRLLEGAAGRVKRLQVGVKYGSWAQAA